MHVPLPFSWNSLPLSLSVHKMSASLLVIAHVRILRMHTTLRLLGFTYIDMYMYTCTYVYLLGVCVCAPGPGRPEANGRCAAVDAALVGAEPAILLVCHTHRHTHTQIK